MAIKKVLSVHDCKAEAFLQPFYTDTIGQAIRMISDCLKDPQHPFSKHTADYTLFLLCDYDETTGIFSESQTQSLGNLVEHKITTISPILGTPHSSITEINET